MTEIEARKLDLAISAYLEGECCFDCPRKYGIIYGPTECLDCAKLHNKTHQEYYGKTVAESIADGK